MNKRQKRLLIKIMPFGAVMVLLVNVLNIFLQGEQRVGLLIVGFCFLVGVWVAFTFATVEK